MQGELTLEEEAKQVEELVEGLYKPNNNNKNLKEINNILTKIFNDPEKVELLKFMLFYSKSTNTIVNSANGLYQIITTHFLTIDSRLSLEIYDYLLNFIVLKIF
jgi:hypothetical protein